MKKLYFLLSFVGIGSYAMSQTFVSTTAENRNVVLEEFTGIRCTFCPDGHKKANEFKDANPGDVVLINIHTGGYATKKTDEEPDFTTKYGDAIAQQSDLSGYPAGTVNRRLFAESQNGGTAQSRGTWATTGADVLKLSSPVNVAIQTTLDIDNRKLEIIAEVYYTGNSKNSTNKLNIAILQNNVPGPQTGGSSYYPEAILPDGRYNHQHMLRELVTGQWGETISTTTAGSFFTKTYTYDIPENINDVELLMHNLEVAAFVAEDKQEILTGVSQKVEIPADKKTDLSVEATGSASSNLCATTVTPKLTITNEFDNDITSFDITATLNGKETTKSFEGTLKKGESTDIVWDEVSLNGGSYDITYSAPTNINGGTLLDTEPENSSSFAVKGFSMKDDAIQGGYKASFENALPANFGIDDSKNARYQMYYDASFPNGANLSKGAMLFYIHSSNNVAGQPIHMYMGKMDLSKVSTPGLSYFWAFCDGLFNGTNPTVDIEISDDCGENWTNVHSMTPTKSTGYPSDPNKIYVPGYRDFQWETVSLADYSDKEVIVKMSVTPGSSGNSFWLDEIGFSSDPMSIVHPVVNSISLYPNPVNESATVAFKLESAESIKVNVYNALGQIVANTTAQDFAAGNNQISINTSALEAGIYTIRVENNLGVLATEMMVKN
ncbi:MAG: Omp28-related outer membrane protein [Bacteroidetes bacterium]|nr:Omp28-related outer membrane protein [Bacteroidota bacterium]